MDSSHLYVAPQSPNLKPLGSLAQSARGKEINQARGILLVIGVLTIAVNAFLFYNAPNEVETVLNAEIQKQGPGFIVDQAKLAEVRQTTLMFVRVIYGGTLALGGLFVVFGLIVRQYPVPITITSLVLYILASLGFALLNPMSLAQGFIVKILFIIALCRAIKAALAYEKEAAAAAAEPGGALA